MKNKPKIKIENGQWGIINFNYCLKNTTLNSLERSWLWSALKWCEMKNKGA